MALSDEKTDELGNGAIRPYSTDDTAAELTNDGTAESKTLQPPYNTWNRRPSSGNSSYHRRSLVLERAPDKLTWWKFTLRDWDDDDPQDWWFASIAIPLIAAAVGPLANVLSIAALVVSWRECVVDGIDDSTAEACLWDGDVGKLVSDLNGTSYGDPRWCYWLNAASLIVGFIGNFFLLCNFTKAIRYIIALPVTIIAWFTASGILIGITIAMAVYVPPAYPQQIYSQGYWYAVMAAIFYFFCSLILMMNMVGYFLGHYPQNFTLTDAQRTLILQTMMFFVWLAGGAGIFVALEAGNSGASQAGQSFSYTNALYFCDVTILTIGFGDMYPTNDAGRGIVIPYAVGGIVTLGLMVSSLTRFAAEIGSEKIFQRHIERSRARTVERTVRSSVEIGERPAISRAIETEQQRQATIRFDESKDEQDGEGKVRPGVQRRNTLPGLQRVVTMVNRPKKSKLIVLREEKDRFEAMRRIQEGTEQYKKWYALGVSVTSFGILWCVGAVVFWQSERVLQGMTYFQALYFCYVSLLTIGYGDLAPKSNPGRAFFVVWSLIAIPTITLLVSHLGETIIENFKHMTSALADYTLLPKEGLWRAFIEKHGTIKRMLDKRKEEKAAQTRLEEGLAVGPDPEEEEHPTITQLAEEHLSHHELARRLAKAIQHVAKDVKNNPSKQYSYEEWVEFTRLIRFTAKGGDDVEIEEEEGMIEWDWIGENSPMLAQGSEADFLFERLCESMQRYIMRVSSAAKAIHSAHREPMIFAHHHRHQQHHQRNSRHSGEDGVARHAGHGERGVDVDDTASLTIYPMKRHATYDDED